MTAEDIAVFAREFYAQVDRDALIIDVRRNNGGNIDPYDPGAGAPGHDRAVAATRQGRAQAVTGAL